MSARGYLGRTEGSTPSAHLFLYTSSSTHESAWVRGWRLQDNDVVLVSVLGHVKKYPGLSSAPASIFRAAWIFLFFLNHYFHAIFSRSSVILKTRVHIDNVDDIALGSWQFLASVILMKSVITLKILHHTTVLRV